MNYIPTIGLEIHVQLKTKSKMFCTTSAQYFGAEPNTHVCPVCLGLPGALPVPNSEAIHKTLIFGLALNCEIPQKSKFDRKNYFYPDMPKNYQISQYDMPFCGKGYLEIELPDGTKKEVKITRAHLEEDAGKLSHAHQMAGHKGGDYSLVDFNRASVPLLEIVSEPDLDNALEARLYAERVHQIARYLGVADTEMEKAGMRFDANVSIRPEGTTELGTKVEVKNVNSFKFLEKAIEYEIKRQTEVLEEGGTIIQETRGYVEDKNITVTQRSKEQAHDYRYFPEPDIPEVVITPEMLEKAKTELVELPSAKINRFMEQFGLSMSDAQLLTLSRATADWYEEAVRVFGETETTEKDARKKAKLVSNWILNDTFARLNASNMKFEDLKFEPAKMVELLYLLDQGKINQTAAKEIFGDMFETGAEPAKVMAEKGLEIIEDTGELEGFVHEVIESNPKPVADFKSGKEQVMGFLVGQVMAKSRGKANPGKVRELLIKKLK